MELFSRYHAWRDQPGKGEGKPPPDKGFKRYNFIVKTHFSKLVLLNLLFLVFSIPIITIPASISGMTRVLMRLTREGFCDLWADFIGEFKSFFSLKLLAWLVLFAVPAMIAMLIAFLIPGIPAAGLWLALSAVSYTIQGYLFPIWAILDVPFGANIKNAFALCAMEWKKSILILCTASVHVLCYFFFPVSVPFMLLFTFSFTQLLICVIANEPINKHLVRDIRIPQEAPACTNL